MRISFDHLQYTGTFKVLFCINVKLSFLFVPLYSALYKSVPFHDPLKRLQLKTLASDGVYQKKSTVYWGLTALQIYTFKISIFMYYDPDLHHVILVTLNHVLIQKSLAFFIVGHRYPCRPRSDAAKSRG